MIYLLIFPLPKASDIRGWFEIRETEETLLLPLVHLLGDGVSNPEPINENALGLRACLGVPSSVNALVSQSALIQKFEEDSQQNFTYGCPKFRGEGVARVCHFFLKPSLTFLFLG